MTTVTRVLGVYGEVSPTTGVAVIRAFPGGGSVSEAKPVRYFLVDPILGVRACWPCDAQGQRARAPMRPGGAPPEVILAWSEDDWARWDSATRAGRAAFDAWHEAHGPRNGWDLAREFPGDECVLLRAEGAGGGALDARIPEAGDSKSRR